MITGTISLYTATHELLKVKEYYTIGQRNGIINIWMEKYKEGYLQIAPQHHNVFDKIKARSYRSLKRDGVKEPVERPPAKYNNLPVYNYDEKKNGTEK